MVETVKEANMGTSSALRTNAYQLIIRNLERHPNREMTITPDMAKQLLEEHNLHNRPTRQATIDRYANDMANNRWIANGETIKFDLNGILVDGQHRLWACFQSEAAFDTYIAINVPADAFETIDIGVKRNPSDSLAVAGMEKFSSIAAPAIRVIIAYDRKAQGMAMNVAQISNAEVVDFWKKNGGNIDNVCGHVSKMRPPLKRMVPTSSLVSFIYFAGTAGHGEEIIQGFCERLETGADLSKDSPILTLRNKLNERLAKRVKEDVFEVLIWCIRAFNAYASGKKLGTIYGSSTSTRGDSYPPIRAAKPTT